MQQERRVRRLVLGIRQIQFVKRHQIRNVHWTFDRIHILFLQLKRLAQHFDHWNTHCGRDFEPHTKSESPLAQRLLDRLQKVFRFIFFDFDIGVARDAEWLAFQDGALRKQRSNVCRDEMLEQDELAVSLTRINRGTLPGIFTRANRGSSSRRCTAAAVCQVQADVRNIRKRMPRIDCQGRQDGKHPLDKKRSKVASSSDDKSGNSTSWISRSLKAGRISLTRQSVCSFSRGRKRSAMRLNCVAGVRPSGERESGLVSSCSCKPRREP